MTGTAMATPEREAHPSAYRHRVSPASLAFGLFAPALAWSLHLLINLAVANFACQTGWAHSGDDVSGTMLLSSLCALGLCAAAARTSWQTWEATRHEHRGAQERLLEVGEGRTRFLGFVGLILAGGFFAATLFDTLALFMVPLCG
jgi:hypothetical protein